MYAKCYILWKIYIFCKWIWYWQEICCKHRIYIRVDFESMFPWKNIVYVMRKQNLNENQNSRDITWLLCLRCQQHFAWFFTYIWEKFQSVGWTRNRKTLQILFNSCHVTHKLISELIFKKCYFQIFFQVKNGKYDRNKLEFFYKKNLQ